MVFHVCPKRPFSHSFSLYPETSVVEGQAVEPAFWLPPTWSKIQGTARLPPNVPHYFHRLVIETPALFGIWVELDDEEKEQGFHEFTPSIFLYFPFSSELVIFWLTERVHKTHLGQESDILDCKPKKNPTAFVSRHDAY